MPACACVTRSPARSPPMSAYPTMASTVVPPTSPARRARQRTRCASSSAFAPGCEGSGVRSAEIAEEPGARRPDEDEHGDDGKNDATDEIEPCPAIDIVHPQPVEQRSG